MLFDCLALAIFLFWIDSKDLTALPSLQGYVYTT